tara:strand:+ start:13525 stop:14091 length:567 start_codon:yes stop_codon:yes gene_type:complete
MAGLRKQQLLFVKEYVVDLNGTQAAIRAGYSEKTAQEQASRLLSNVKVQQAIAKEQNKRLERTEVSADYVLKRLVEIDEMDVCDILSDDLSSFKPLSQWPKVWRRTISGLDLTELFSGRGDEKEMTGILKKIKWPDKVKNLELLGKHIDIQAFKEKRELEGELTVNNLIAEISSGNGENRAVLPKHSK